MIFTVYSASSKKYLHFHSHKLFMPIIQDGEWLWKREVLSLFCAPLLSILQTSKLVDLKRKKSRKKRYKEGKQGIHQNNKKLMQL